MRPPRFVVSCGKWSSTAPGIGGAVKDGGTDVVSEVQMFRGSVEVVVRRGDQFLVVTNRKWGGFSMPGGKLDKGESLEAGARRELLEETGLTALSLKRIGGAIHKSQPKDGGPDWFCMAFEADIGDQEPSEVEEGSRPYWTTQEDIRKNALYPDYYEWLFDFLRPVSIENFRRLIKTPVQLGFRRQSDDAPHGGDDMHRGASSNRSGSDFEAGYDEGTFDK
jgi:8-oxo-dGTP pyrophosphatase MutT (NUDIX family)